jgi:vanillate O-demethylase ferredoxin subunit
MGEIAVIVKDARQVTAAIRELLLVSETGADLPPWQPGAHIEVDVALPGGAVETRAYAIVGGVGGEDDPASAYRIAVERDPESRGGSRYLCEEVAVGARLAISPPRNDFPIHLHEAERLLVAGGIGIAPLYAMARVYRKRGTLFQLHYTGPGEAEMAYRQELQDLCGDQVHFHYDGGRLDLEPELEALGYPAEVYVCAQRPLLKAVVASAMEHGLSRVQIVQQCFDPPPPPVPNDNIGFEVELRNSGITAHVPPDASILETLLSAGYQAQFYCGRGECGFCPLPVLETDGAIEHRDHYLQPEEKGEQLCICVSRLKSGTKLVLDA